MLAEHFNFTKLRHIGQSNAPGHLHTYVFNLGTARLEMNKENHLPWYVKRKDKKDYLKTSEGQKKNIGGKMKERLSLL